jgi:hypothetical protein
MHYLLLSFLIFYQVVQGDQYGRLMRYGHAQIVLNFRDGCELAAGFCRYTMVPGSKVRSFAFFVIVPLIGTV